MGASTSFGSVAVVAASIALVGCTTLNGNDNWEPSGDDPIVAADDPVTLDVPAPKGMSCAYPQAATYGVSQGMVVSAFTNWIGLPPNEPERQFHLAEYFDCDAMKGVDAILITTSQYG